MSRLDAQVLLGLSASYELRPGMRAYTRLNNLLDRSYQRASDRVGVPATGVVGVELRF